MTSSKTFKPQERTCANCGGKFKTKSRRRRIYCDAQCRWEKWSQMHPRIGVGEGVKVSNEPESFESGR